MRQKIVAGNWKMHKTAEETEDLLNELINKIPTDIEQRESRPVTRKQQTTKT